MNPKSTFDMQSEEGQGLVEYGLILVLVSITVVGALGLLASSILGLSGWSLF